jgi:glyoxylase-like metal-dependent hydrolase (beta-lactamase superfamily II)
MNGSSKATSQRSNAYSVMVGDIKITAILESYTESPPGLLTGWSEELLQSRQAESLRGLAAFISINCFLIEIDGRVILVDTGLGGEVTAATGRLEVELRSIGMELGDISHVLLTHLHADHFGGAISEAGICRFPNARFLAHRAEHDYCFGGNKPAGNPMAVQQYQFAQRLRPILSQFDWVEEGQIIPGVELVHLPGHTPGHSGFRVRRGQDSVLLWGDIVHQPHQQFADPSIGVSYDVDPAMATETRRKIMAEAMVRKDLIAGTHTDFPAFGRVKAEGDGYCFVPLVWSSAINKALAV